MNSVSDRTRAALLDRPHVLEALAEGVANVAAVARMIDIEGASLSSVETAIRREVSALAPSDPVEISVRVDRSIEQLAVDVPSDGVVVRAVGADLAHHRATLGRLGAANVTIHATQYTDGIAEYAVDRTATADVIAAAERPVSDAVRASVHSNAKRENEG